MVGHGESSAISYLADPTSPIPSHCASIVATSTLRVKLYVLSKQMTNFHGHKHFLSHLFPTYQDLCLVIERL